MEIVPKNEKNAILEPNGLLKAANTATYHTPYWALREYVGHPYRVSGEEKKLDRFFRGSICAAGTNPVCKIGAATMLKTPLGPGGVWGALGAPLPTTPHPFIIL